jgi:hypothetical protein
MYFPDTSAPSKGSYKLLLIAVLALALILVSASVVLAQSRGPSGADGTFNCDDFDTRQQAQAFYDEDPSDPDGLDDDDDGEACESLPGGGTDDNGDETTDNDMTNGENGGATEDQYEDGDEEPMDRTPETGGPALLLVAGLLMGLGALGLGVSRRRRS